MLYGYDLGPGNIHYNPCGDGIRGCLLCIMAALEELETDVDEICNNLSDNDVSEQLQKRLEQLKEVMEHTVQQEFFL